MSWCEGMLYFAFLLFACGVAALRSADRKTEAKMQLSYIFASTSIHLLLIYDTSFEELWYIFPSFSEIKQLLRRYLQHFTEFENHIERNAYIAKFDSTDMASVYVGHFGQFHLGQSLLLAIIDHLQTKLLIILLVLLLHNLTSNNCR